MAELNTQISAIAGQPASVRVGTVTSINPTVVSAQGTVFTNVGFADPYRPRVGDVVALLGQSSSSGSDPSSWLAIASLKAVPNGPQAGEVSVSFTTLTSFTQAVVFPQPFTAVPNVFVNINTGAGSTSLWQARAINITTTGFTLFVYTTGGAVSWVLVPVGWAAVPRTA